MSTFLELADLDDIVVRCRLPLRSDEVCLACLHADARLELLTGPWESVLGLKPAQLEGRRLCSLLAGDRDAARAALERLLDPLAPEPVMMDVRVEGGALRALHVYRHFDPYEPSLYFACEPLENSPPMSRTSSSVSFFSSA